MGMLVVHPKFQVLTCTLMRLVELSGAVSSQYLTATLMASSLELGGGDSFILKARSMVPDISASLQVELSGAVSSQYLTALLMAAPLATGEDGITIRIRDELVSQPYVDMTVRLMERFGIQVLISTQLLV